MLLDDRSARLRGQRHGRRRAAPDHVHGPGRARRIDADAAASRHARCRGPGRRSRFGRAESPAAASARSGGCIDPGRHHGGCGRTEMQLDQRHLDPDALAAMLDEALTACRPAAEAFGCTLRVQRVSSAPLRPRSIARLVQLAPDAVAGGRRRRRRADPERPAARRDRDRPHRSDGDDLRPVRPAALACRDREFNRRGARGRDRCLRADGRAGCWQRGRYVKEPFRS